ncbi:hypothetical protein KR018_001644, partial [Drosophila ironensis]
FVAGAGAYEDGMQIDEMRNLVNVMQSSVICNQPQEDADLERALLESQLEFVGAQAGTLMNSTMIGPPVGPLLVPERSTSPASDRLCESPPTLPVHFTVRAVVHRPLNWEPGNLSPSAARKRPLSERNDLAPEVEIKRARPSISEPARRSVIEEYNPDHTPLTVDENESSENWPEVSIISLLSDEESAMESIGEMPSRHLISTSSAVVSDFSRSQQESQS